MDSNIILSVTITTGILILVIYEIAKLYINNTVRLWANAFDSIKEKNHEMKNRIEELEGCLDFQYKQHEEHCEELRNEIKKLEKQLNNK